MAKAFAPMTNCPEPPWDHLDPGIVNAVKLFVELGFTPCDSGDGESKGESGMVTPFPHVTLLTTPDRLVGTCRAVLAALEAHGFDMEQIDVQGIYPVSIEPDEAFVCVGGEPLKGIIT